MFLWALRVCSPEFLDREVNRIFDIADKLKYPKHLVDKSLSMAKKSFYGLGRKEVFNPKNLLVLPFNENLVSLPKILKVFNVHVLFRNSNTVKNVLIKNPHVIKKDVFTVFLVRIVKKYILARQAKT